MLLLLYEYFITPTHNQKVSFKTLVLRFYLPLVGVIILYLCLRLIALGGIGPRGEHIVLADKSFFQRLALVPAIYVLNFSLLVFPFRLTTIYDIKIDTHLFPLSPGLSLIVLLIVCVALIWSLRKKYIIPAFGLLWVLVSILPVSNIIPLGMIASERALFFPSIGFCIMLGGIAGLFIRPARHIFKVEQNLYVFGLVAVVVVFYTIRSIDRTKDWQTPFTFWNSELAMHPNSGAAHNSLGWYFYNIGDRTQAKKEFTRAIECEPERKRAYYNLIKVLIEERNFKQARDLLAKVAKLGPGPLGSNFVTIGTLYMELNDEKTAEEFYRKALKVYPRHSTA
ncbi:tetratricopeptide repeat protein, partial [Candidatus Sumerlaeota bacterium]|nr:tetratricopeptide repeat protein [Candidatus Sumerlaeota bacterium]